MTKLTFDVDFNKDPEEILRDIQERAKAEVAKRESKEKTKFYLTSLHKRVNEDLGTKYASINDLIRALTSYANPKGRAKVAISPTGRRVTISMNKEIFDEIKSLLAQPIPTKQPLPGRPVLVWFKYAKWKKVDLTKSLEEIPPHHPLLLPLSQSFQANLFLQKSRKKQPIPYWIYPRFPKPSRLPVLRILPPKQSPKSRYLLCLLPLWIYPRFQMIIKQMPLTLRMKQSFHRQA
jgi:hypothetical protein